MNRLKKVGRGIKRITDLVREEIVDPVFITENYKQKIDSIVSNALREAGNRPIDTDLDIGFLNKEHNDKDLTFFGNALKYSIHDKPKNHHEEAMVLEHKIRDVPEKMMDKAETVIFNKSDVDIGLNTLLSYYRQKEIVGEESLCLLQTFAAIQKMSFGIEGPSGSGKSFVIDKLIHLLPEKSVYHMGLSSKTAEMYNASEINKSKIIYIPELQKTMNSSNALVVEVLKNLTEGKDATRTVRDQGRKKNLNLRINAGVGVIYTLALENGFKKDVEFSRRVCELYTDISKAHLDEVLKAFAEKQYTKKQDRQLISFEEESSLKDHIKHCLNNDFSNYINPFAAYLDTNIPRETKAQSFNKHYFNLMKGSANFNQENRIITDEKDIFLSIQDAYLVHSLYGKQFMLSVLKVPWLGKRILDKVQKAETSPYDIYEMLKQEEAGVSLRTVEVAMDNLSSINYLKKDKKRAVYSPTNTISDFSNSIDWEICFKSALEIMYMNFPDIAENWLESQIKTGNRVEVYDPINKQEIVLLEVKR